MEGINIWSGSKEGIGAALTNPTELAFKKGTLTNHYPVRYKGINYADAEEAYQKLKTLNHQENMTLMIEIILAKLEQHPRLIEAIAKRGGVEWLEKCSHIVVGNKLWEGQGTESNFIVCLIFAYLRSQ